ncbi:MAG: tetratricopeptide repeat protein [Bryobacterales bacterium]|nr:tetratricopeptide repeat protein [Bryobacterales bacterium]
MREIAAICLVLSSTVSWCAAQDDLLRRAAQLDSEGKCAEAEQYYKQAFTRAPSSPAVLNNFGNHHLTCGRPEAAREYFERLLKLVPAHPNANLQLARMAAEAKQGAKALAYLAHVKSSNPAILLLRAEALHWAGRRAEAANALDGVERDARANLPVLFTLGLTCARLGLYTRAESAFSAVLAQRPGDFNVLLNLGRAAARAGNYDRALRALEVAARVQPDDAETLLEIGLVHLARQDYSRAVYVLAQARQRAPKRPDILLPLAQAAEYAGYYGDSALAYDEYLQLRPGDAAARRDRGRVYAYTGTRLEEGLRELNRYVQSHPKDPLGYFSLAQFSWKDRPEQSLEQLDSALRLDPKLLPARFARAWLLHRMGRTADSLPDLEAILRMDPKNARALDQLGLSYLTLDQAARAEPVLRRALALSPRDPEISLHLGRTLMELGREEEARRFLAEFRKMRPANVRGPLTEAGMIELAALSSADRRKREIERLRNLNKERPDEPEFRLALARILLSDGRVEEAAAEFQQLLTRQLESRLCEEAGAALLRAGQYPLARDFLQRAVADRPAVRLDLAIAVFFTGGAEQALEVIGTIPAGEHAGDYLLMKARILDAAGRKEEAAAVLAEGLRRAATRPQVVEQAAVLLLAQKRHADAVALLDQALRSAPDSGELLLVRAAALARTGRLADARQAVRALESRWPEWDGPYVLDGLLLERAARPAEARRKFETALALGSRNPAARCGLARLESAASAHPECACHSGLDAFPAPACGQP